MKNCSTRIQCSSRSCHPATIPIRSTNRNLRGSSIPAHFLRDRTNAKLFSQMNPQIGHQQWDMYCTDYIEIHLLEILSGRLQSEAPVGACSVPADQGRSMLRHCAQYRMQPALRNQCPARRSWGLLHYPHSRLDTCEVFA